MIDKDDGLEGVFMVNPSRTEKVIDTIRIEIILAEIRVEKIIGHCKNGGFNVILVWYKEKISFYLI